MKRTVVRTPRNDAVYRGIIVYWNDEKGYGFLKTNANEPNIFFHISAYAYENRRPEKGRRVLFLLEQAEERPQALRIVEEGDEHGLFNNNAVDAANSGPHFFEAGIYTLLVIVFYIALATLSLPIAAASLIISVMTFLLYSLDKHAAIHDRHRVPEASLHLASLLGGWPGALIARPLLRHKTRKNRFIVFFWMSVVINFFCLYLLTWYLADLFLHP